MTKSKVDAGAELEQPHKEIAELEARIAKNTRTLDVLRAQQAAVVDVRRDKKATVGAIRQGVKASVDTVPMPVRLEVSQVKGLKILAALEGTTASAIIRDCIKDHLDQKASENATFANALLMTRDTE